MSGGSSCKICTKSREQEKLIKKDIFEKVLLDSKIDDERAAGSAQYRYDDRLNDLNERVNGLKYKLNVAQEQIKHLTFN